MAESGTVQVPDDRMREELLEPLHRALWYLALPQAPPPCGWPTEDCTCPAAMYADGAVAADAAWRRAQAAE